MGPSPRRDELFKLKIQGYAKTTAINKKNAANLISAFYFKFKYTSLRDFLCH